MLPTSWWSWRVPLVREGGRFLFAAVRDSRTEGAERNIEYNLLSIKIAVNALHRVALGRRWNGALH